VGGGELCMQEGVRRGPVMRGKCSVHYWSMGAGRASAGGRNGVIQNHHNYAIILVNSLLRDSITSE
jgi:hypothetical protein